MMILDTGCQSVEENMAIDARLLEELDPDGPAIVHLYRWQGDCGTYGHFITPSDFLNMDAVDRHGLKLARRPTGGGIVFHISDFAFSVLIPSGHSKFSLNTLENYGTINRAVIEAVGQFAGLDGPCLLPDEVVASDAASQHFCMAKPTKYDVMVDGRKIGGAAQRRRRQGLLHQGSIAVAALPPAYLADILLPGSDVLQNMQSNSYTLLGDNWTAADLEQLRGQLSELLVNNLQQVLGQQTSLL